MERSVYRWGEQETPVDSIIINPFNELKTHSVDLNKRTDKTIQPTFKIEPNVSLKEQTKNLQIYLVKEALKNTQCNQKKAADSLGLSYDQMRGLIRKYRLT